MRLYAHTVAGTGTQALRAYRSYYPLARNELGDPLAETAPVAGPEARMPTYCLFSP